MKRTTLTTVKNNRSFETIIAKLAVKNILTDREMMTVKGGEGDGTGTIPTPPPPVK